MRQTSFAEFHCSLSRALEVMGDWWTPLILRDVHLGVDRFDDLVTDLGISRNLLVTRLRGLVDDGLLVQEPYSEHPPRHRYVLTGAGAELVPILLTLTAWGDRHQTPPGGPPLRVRHRGHACQPVVACAKCGEQLHADDVDLLPGPGGRRAPGTMVVAERVVARATMRRRT